MTLWSTEGAPSDAGPSAPLTIRNGSLDPPRPPSAMAPERTHRGDGLDPDRKARKPLVEKKRRARINKSLQELRLLIADTDWQSKLENAEVLEMTVRRVENILQSRTQEVEASSREACERFAAGYIQCMHDVHTFVSTCPGIDQTVAAELLNHLMESMPLNDEDRLQVAPDGPNSGRRSLAHPPWEVERGPQGSPAPSSSSGDDLFSDLDETESDQSQFSSSEEAEIQDLLSLSSTDHSKSPWRPW